MNAKSDDTDWRNARSDSIISPPSEFDYIRVLNPLLAPAGLNGATVSLQALLLI